MIPQFVHGCIAPVFTAWNEDGSFDPDGQRAILDYLLETKSVSAYFVRSGMGQMYTFEYDDVKKMAETTCKHFAGKAPILVGATGIWDRDFSRRPDPAAFTKQAIELSQFAETVGAAGVVHTMPEAIAPKDGETYADVILRYFDTIQACVKIPVFIYQPPGTDEHYRSDAALIARLADLPNIMGMKVSTSDAEYTFNLTYAVAGKDFGYICGCETAFLAALVSGARAAIGQGATVSPQVLKAVQTCYEKGDLKGAIEAQHVTNLLVQKSPSTVEFFKTYIAEKGYKIKPIARAGGNPYATTAVSLTQEEYTSYKKLLEEQLAKYSCWNVA